jgi:DtxR family transcriptional regulator, Mn-dependent transcriptional regulator
MTKAEEDYIKYIYEASIERLKDVKSIDIAHYFSYTEQSVNQMIKQLSQKGYLTFIPYKSITLTELGIKHALKMIRAHRVWEVFLEKKLQYPWEKVHDLSEVLEHNASEEFVDKLFLFLDAPLFCPHGNPIPPYQREETIGKSIDLTQVEAPCTFLIERVNDYPELLTLLSTFHIGLQSVINILKNDAVNEYILISFNDRRCDISYKYARMIFGSIQ